MGADKQNISPAKPKLSIRQIIMWVTIGASMVLFGFAAYYWIQASGTDEAEEIIKYQNTYRGLFVVIIVILVILTIYQIIPYLKKGNIEIEKDKKS